MTLSEQCKKLSIDLNIVNWNNKGKPEPYALELYVNQGYRGAYCEGGAIGVVLKSLCLDALTESSIFFGTNFDAREDACLKGMVVFSQLESNKLKLVLDQIQTTSKSIFLSSFREILSYDLINSWHPGLTIEFASDVYDAVSKSEFVRIAEWVSLDSSHRNGWPDLTVVSENKLSFVEVKTTDKLHASQMTTIPALKEMGFNVSVIKLDSKT
ncbi:VRR-NUC domain-containing protein [Colwellia sp. RSH04]|uniref:VRR-NUC domain-containing protein n=1 Tax=Colwellia sp. RSH04 TaxID=2305464 RepID=UPI000E567D33|nr:VRR-NUC domain-containing protein [Colwellia sp. RSH04]RHW77903.1 VRR-NUC domain-containing protein [Colwellia sp. RSH04]